MQSVSHLWRLLSAIFHSSRDLQPDGRATQVTKGNAEIVTHLRDHISFCQSLFQPSSWYYSSDETDAHLEPLCSTLSSSCQPARCEVPKLIADKRRACNGACPRSWMTWHPTCHPPSKVFSTAAACTTFMPAEKICQQRKWIGAILLPPPCFLKIHLSRS